MWAIEDGRGVSIVQFAHASESEYLLRATETVAQAYLPQNEWIDFVMHYKAVSQTVDAYVNGALVAADFTIWDASVYRVSVSGEFCWDSQENPTGSISFRGIKLGQYRPGSGCGPGDADGDGDVDDNDLSLLLANWGMDTDCAHGEFNSTPPVDDNDLSLLLAHWTGSGAVPEPATLALLALGAIVLTRRGA